MMLYLRFQIEEYAFSPKKWGSPEALDVEFERREGDKKRRREAKFKTKLDDLKKRTRVDAYRRNRKGATGGNFGDDMGGGETRPSMGAVYRKPGDGHWSQDMRGLWNGGRGAGILSLLYTSY